MAVLRFMTGLLLLPVCGAVARTLIRLLLGLGHWGGDVAAWLPVLWLGIGSAAWLLVFGLLPAPMRAYVLAHELTHALWGLAMGKKIKGMTVGRTQGSVTMTGTNVWVTLAPYFFPFYTACVIALYYALAPFLAVERWQPLWLALVGFTWCFHLTFTVASLLERQPDIRSCGRLFSYTLIFILNMIGVCFWLVCVTPIAVEGWLRLLATDLAWAYRGVWRGLAGLAELAGRWMGFGWL